MIIDIHSHLGDILNPKGGELINKKGIKKQPVKDVIDLFEKDSFRNLEELEIFDGLDEDEVTIMITKSAQARNLTATLENMRRSMDHMGITKSVCLPVPPYVVFEDLKKAQQFDADIIPFSGVDFYREYDVEAALNNDVAQGAKGIKIHPIIQSTPLNSEKVFRAVEAFAPHGLPVLFHCGLASYYLGEDKDRRQVPEYGEIGYAKELVAAFPNVSFIAGHAGVRQIEDAIELLGEFNNVWVDISFQAPEKIVELVSVFGPERVLYASDWPWGNHAPTIKMVEEACRGDNALKRLIFFENATQLLKL